MGGEEILPPLTLQHKSNMENKECKLHEGALGIGGYGRKSYKGITYRAHRLAYALEYLDGDMDKLKETGLYVLHKCDNRSCINPEHLYLGTAKDNARDMIKRNRGIIGEKGATAILKEEQVKDIRKRYRPYRKKDSGRELAKEYNVSDSTIYAIVNNVNWRHLNDE